MPINRSQLAHTYSWNAIPPDDPRVTGKADGVFLNRREGYEVLAFLRKHCADLAAAHKAERLIQTKLPGNIRSRANVFTWLKTNWSIFP